MRKTPLNSEGYLHVQLWWKGRRQGFKVHRLVAAAFLGPCPAGKECNHKDGNRTNAALSNLEYVTQSENTLHSYRVLGRKPAPSYGEEHGRAKLKEEQVFEIIRRYKGGERQTALASHYDVSQTLVSQIVSGQTWGWLTGITRMG
jgi:hypothetical protein